MLGDGQMWVFHPGPLIPEQQLTVNTDTTVEYGQLLGQWSHSFSGKVPPSFPIGCPQGWCVCHPSVL